MPVKTVTINHGWVVDSRTMNGDVVGNSVGGNMATFQLESSETITSVTADQIRYQSEG